MSQSDSATAPDLDRRGVPDHLTKERPHRSPSKLSADEPREFWCKVCNYRVTADPRLERSYGHKRGCPHKLMLGDRPKDG